MWINAAKHAVSFWNRVVLARRFLSQRWLLSMTNVLLHPYLPDVSSSSFCFIASYTKIQLVLLHCRVETLQWSLPCRCYTRAVTHQSPRDYAQVMQRKRREDGAPKHLRYLQNVSADNHLLLAEVADHLQTL
ncbi:hypothetical protein DAPPUDRAFT_236092 [Daphnia pulex]|uniref:Uncharacterized protein n=1 Tax=Daphnia pulex TaxID=6669 RepID=E9FZY1_DAPPU|nr:hypothetical protein DAPPUDRAFT_236092 [Daphnia pulex]|eukprot:EFX87126.1 hypothetical protein DAPPUDRAFT_236092 [Daphnia pulex]